MRDFFATWRGPSGVCRDFRFGWAGVLLAIWATQALPVVSAERATSPRQVVPFPGGRVTSLVTASDVILQAGGVLQGVVFSAASTPGARMAVAGARVTLIRDGKVAAETVSDRSGRFAVSHLRGGKYLIVVTTESGTEWNLCRAWTANAAPPKANVVAQVALGQGLIRGQGPLPSLSFPEAALMGGVVVGAVAAPVIYHNAQQSNRVPASP